ncbi:NAC domain-containing protein 104-like [Nicotiana tabacum]|uniref:NAC domain-containing protein 104-like n=1 Tax=Nicotiana tabacum TaxID=4097 RepID=A0AC58SJN9_TOBAC
MGDNNNVNLPPGFRFSPTDEELVVHFLQRKASLLPCHPDIIPDLHLYPYDPWDLDAGKTMAVGNKWYFYSRITNETRITGNGYWQPVGVDESILSSSNHKVIGTKKYYGFYMGDEPPQGHKTNWLMQEYRLSHSSASTSSSNRSSSRRSTTHSTNEYSKWVICCRGEVTYNSDNDSAELSCLDEVFLSLDDLDDDNISSPH